jgi:hypothetical protein
MHGVESSRLHKSLEEWAFAGQQNPLQKAGTTRSQVQGGRDYRDPQTRLGGGVMGQNDILPGSIILGEIEDGRGIERLAYHQVGSSSTYQSRRHLQKYGYSAR